MLTVVPPKSEIKKTYELHFPVGEFEKLDSYKTVWRIVNAK